MAGQFCTGPNASVADFERSQRPGAAYQIVIGTFPVFWARIAEICWEVREVERRRFGGVSIELTHTSDAGAEQFVISPPNFQEMSGTDRMLFSVWKIHDQMESTMDSLHLFQMPHPARPYADAPFVQCSISAVHQCRSFRTRAQCERSRHANR
jgi:hypothetical protein